MVDYILNGYTIILCAVGLVSIVLVAVVGPPLVEARLEHHGHTSLLSMLIMFLLYLVEITIVLVIFYKVGITLPFS